MVYWFCFGKMSLVNKRAAADSKHPELLLFSAGVGGEHAEIQSYRWSVSVLTCQRFVQFPFLWLYHVI